MKKEGWIPLDAKTIPYWSRLNAAIGNVTASIMLTQMEYWFARYPKGFYKFRGRPEHPHPAYQEGKSWTEELSITISQYKTAFQKLGTVFPKDCKWDTDFGEMAFRGMLYASHFHPRD
ncbi:MAG: hypothetical protein KDK37_18605, partial [Leptospiraceae bacterium]|nr:hypothetical protein [Leptospiraceae bacterium]